MAKARPTIVGLFSGAGGLDLGLHEAGFRPLALLDFDDDSVETLRLNRGRLGVSNDRIVHRNVVDVSSEELGALAGVRNGELHLLAGGPPCQAFTTTGCRRALNDDRGSVVHHYLRLLRGLRPRYFLMENVTGFFSAALRHRPLAKRGRNNPPLAEDESKGSVFRWFLNELVDAGYSVAWGVVDAVDFGVPQFRQRAVLIGTRSADPVFLPSPTHVKDARGARRWKTLRDAVGNLHEDKPILQPLSATKQRVFRLIPPGGNWRSLPERVRRETMGAAFSAEGGKSGWWRRLAWDRPTPTILTMPDHSSTGLIHPDETRCLSVRECARAQTFPDVWQFAGQPRSQYRQIGNAVPVLLARRLGEHVIAHMAGERERVPSAPVWRQESANQRLGTWGWVSNRDGRVVVLNHRADHVHLAPHQLALELLTA
jgi:DNA (cytosine-5)-methyltransferase 1